MCNWKREKGMNELAVLCRKYYQQTLLSQCTWLFQF